MVLLNIEHRNIVLFTLTSTGVWAWPYKTAIPPVVFGYNQLTARPSRLVTVGERSFASAGLKPRNSLPDDIISASPLTVFRRRLKHIYFGSHIRTLLCSLFVVLAMVVIAVILGYHKIAMQCNAIVWDLWCTVHQISAQLNNARLIYSDSSIWLGTSFKDFYPTFFSQIWMNWNIPSLEKT